MLFFQKKAILAITYADFNAYILPLLKKSTLFPNINLNVKIRDFSFNVYY